MPAMRWPCRAGRTCFQDQRSYGQVGHIYLHVPGTPLPVRYLPCADPRFRRNAQSPHPATQHKQLCSRCLLPPLGFQGGAEKVCIRHAVQVPGTAGYGSICIRLAMGDVRCGVSSNSLQRGLLRPKSLASWKMLSMMPGGGWRQAKPPISVTNMPPPVA
jgi:hypothetical protein